jgi:hypothetical protein
LNIVFVEQVPNFQLLNLCSMWKKWSHF